MVLYIIGVVIGLYVAAALLQILGKKVIGPYCSKTFGFAEYYCSKCGGVREKLFRRSKGTSSIKCKCGEEIASPRMTRYF